MFSEFGALFAFSFIWRNTSDQSGLAACFTLKVWWCTVELELKSMASIFKLMSNWLIFHCCPDKQQEICPTFPRVPDVWIQLLYCNVTLFCVKVCHRKSRYVERLFVSIKTLYLRYEINYLRAVLSYKTQSLTTSYK